MLFRAGSPTHPSFPAGHAITAGACMTILKAWFDESVLFPKPVKPTDDGLAQASFSRCGRCSCRR
jgi:membrane-associated phospholipid phosphatase